MARAGASSSVMVTSLVALSGPRYVTQCSNQERTLPEFPGRSLTEQGTAVSCAVSLESTGDPHNGMFGALISPRCRAIHEMSLGESSPAVACFRECLRVSTGV